MALYQRREIPGRTRFLLALSLSTVTAVGVAAPLALQALRADESTVAYVNPTIVEPDELDSDPGPELTIATDGGGIGGIGARPPAKGQGQTTKTETDDGGAGDPSPDESVLTNPSGPEAETTSSTKPPTSSTSTSQPTTSSTAPPPTEPTTSSSLPTTSTTQSTSSTTAAPEPTIPATEDTTPTSSSTTTSGAGG